MNKRVVIISLLFIVLISVGAVATWAMLPKDTSKVENKKTPATSREPIATPQLDTFSVKGIRSGATIKNNTTIRADMDDTSEVARVEFHLDGELHFVAYSPPYEYTIRIKTLSAGDHKLTIKVYDDSDNILASKGVEFSVVRNKKSSVRNSMPDAVSAEPSFSQPSTIDKRSYTSNSPSNTPSSSPKPNKPRTPKPSTEPTESTDTTPPAAPTGLSLSSATPYVVAIDWNQATDDTETYKVYRDNQLLATTENSTYDDKTVVPGNSYSYHVVALDEKDNSSQSSTQPTIRLQSTSVWMDFDRPKNSYDDSTGLELGTKIKPLVDGTMTGVRFYKPLGAIGTHTAKLWDTAGNVIAQGTSTTESSSGWQEVQFDSSVAVTEDTEYTVSYSASDGNYVATGDYFTSAGIKSQYLEAPAGSPGNKNGVYSATPGNRPTTATETNYWVDGLFSPAKDSGGPLVQQPTDVMTLDGYPDSSDTGVIGKRLPVRDRAPDIAEAGMTISGVDLQIPYWNISKNDTTLQDVKITYTGGFDVGNHLVYIPAGVTGTEIYDSEFDGNDAIQRTIQGINGITVKRSNLHHTGDAIEVAENMLIEDNFIHHIRAPENVDWHPDGVQSSSSTMNNIIRHNTILLTGPSTGAINICGLAGDTISNVLIENNLMAGGGYTLYAGAGTNVNYRILNNKFSTRYYPTVGDHNIYYDSFMSGVTVSGNTIYETSAPADQNL